MNLVKPSFLHTGHTHTLSRYRLRGCEPYGNMAFYRRFAARYRRPYRARRTKYPVRKRLGRRIRTAIHKAQERKQFVTTIVDSSVPNLATNYETRNLTQVTQGTDAFERIGSRITVAKVQVKGVIQYSATETLDSTIHIYIVQRHDAEDHTNDSSFLYTNFGDAPPIIGQNKNTTILAHRTFVMGPNNTRERLRFAMGVSYKRLRKNLTWLGAAATYPTNQIQVLYGVDNALTYSPVLAAITNVEYYDS